MELTGVAIRCLTLAVCVSALGGCAQAEAPTVADARAGFCVGVDETHPANGRATVTFMRGDQTLGMVGNVVTGPVSVPVTPGEVQVLVDGKATATLTLSSGSSAYATSGKGCPATFSP